LDITIPGRFEDGGTVVVPGHAHDHSRPYPGHDQEGRYA
jgi:hypothetical protein